MTNPENRSEDFRPTSGTFPENESLTDNDAQTPSYDTTGSAEPTPSAVEYDAPATTPASTTETSPTTTTDTTDGKVKGSFAASTWIALIVGFLLLIVLIIFILQNQHEVPLNFLNWSVEFPAGVTYLICAIAGALIMALVGGWRMFELRRQVRKQAKR